jgi:DNA-binding IclR family transcriptional regulator
LLYHDCMATRAEESSSSSRNVGSQTLARGLRVLEIVATSEQGVTTQEIADHLGVHRTIAYRILATLSDFRLVLRSADGRYRGGAGLAVLGQGIHSTLRGAAESHLRELAREVQSTVALIVEEDDEAVALAVVEPPNAGYHLSFHAGSRHPLDRGAAGVALLSTRPPRPRDSAAVREARERGYARTFGEVEPGAYGVAATLASVEGAPAACVNLITYRADVAERAVPAVLEAVRRIDDALS